MGSTITRTNIRDARPLIRNREAFAAGGNAYGESNFRGGFLIEDGTGRLNAEEAMEYSVAMLSIDYVIRSYGTPIAWHNDNGWYVVEQKFSSSTSRHQSAVRLAIAGI